MADCYARGYPAKFGFRVFALVRTGKEQKQTETNFGIHAVTLPKWVKEYRIDLGEIPRPRAASQRNCVPRNSGYVSWSWNS